MRAVPLPSCVPAPQVCLALLLGSDYTEGVAGIGVVNALEVLSAWPDGLTGLSQFRAWMEAPDERVLAAAGEAVRSVQRRQRQRQQERAAAGAAVLQEGEQQHQAGVNGSSRGRGMGSGAGRGRGRDAGQGGGKGRGRGRGRGRARARGSRRGKQDESESESESEIETDDEMAEPGTSGGGSEQDDEGQLRAAPASAAAAAAEAAGQQEPAQAAPLQADGQQEIVQEVPSSQQQGQQKKPADTPAQAKFKVAHRGVARSWQLPSGFPSARVHDAYLKPLVDRNPAGFKSSQPNEALLQEFCRCVLVAAGSEAGASIAAQYACLPGVYQESTMLVCQESAQPS